MEKAESSDIFVIDNFITLGYQLGIRNVILTTDFQWTYEPATAHPDSDDIFVDSNTQETHQFVNKLFNEYENISHPQLAFFLPLILTAQDHIKTPTRITRVKANLLLQDKSISKELHHTAHVDTKVPHWELIYYVHDSDGDTIIFDQEFGKEFDPLTIKQHVTPKQGRAVIFNGKYFHTSSSPRDHKIRNVLNCTLEIPIGESE
jgi:ectoine hydroxylase-related dioxygenase (phytanoyl-CoA dioxygenase family)